MDTFLSNVIKKKNITYEDIHVLCYLLHNDFDNAYNYLVQNKDTLLSNSSIGIGHIDYNYESKIKFKRIFFNLFEISNCLIKKNHYTFFKYITQKKLNKNYEIYNYIIKIFDTITIDTIQTNYLGTYLPSIPFLGNDKILLDYIQSNPLQVYKYLYNNRKDIFGYFAISLIELSINDINISILEKYKKVKEHIRYMPNGSEYYNVKNHFENLINEQK